MRLWTLVILLGGLLAAGCPATTPPRGGTEVEVLSQPADRPAPPAARGQVPFEPGSSSDEFPAGVAADVQRYLRDVHKLIEAEWQKGVLARAAAMLPAGHPANQLGLVAEIAVNLDLDGQPLTRRVSRTSGYVAFDESALRVMELAQKLPPIPGSVGEGATTLFWRFHRDGRSCSPVFARLEVKSLAAEEEMRRALARGQLDKARQVLEARGPAPALLEQVAATGLASADAAVRRLALQVASREQLEASIRPALRGAESWRMVLGALAARRQLDRLVALLDGLAGAKVDPARLVDLIDTLFWLDARPPAALLARLLAHSDARVVTAAASLVRSAAALDPALARFAKQPAVVGPLLTRKRALAPAGDATVEQAIVQALAGPGALPTLDAIARFSVKSCDADVEALARSSKPPPAVRARAIEVMADRNLALGVLYAALRDPNPPVQIAAARALARAKGNKVAMSYRLGELAARARGEPLAEALIALASLGDDRFRDDTLRRARLLEPPLQARVAEALATYGDRAIPTLTRMAAHSLADLRAAARRALGRIKTDAARQAVAFTHTADPPPASSPLHELLTTAVRLSRPGKP